MTFLDPPFNQQKDYALHNDDMSEADYWAMMENVCQAVFNVTKRAVTSILCNGKKIRNLFCKRFGRPAGNFKI